MVDDRHKSEIARAKFNAMRRHPPSSWDETHVADYNNILAALQAAEPDKDFSGFRVPLSEPAPRVTSFTRGTSRAPGKKFYSSKLYCDDGRMTRRLEGVAAYLADVDAPAPGPAADPVAPDESPAPEPARPGRMKRAAWAVGRFLWAQAQAIVAAVVNAWMKRKGWE